MGCREGGFQKLDLGHRCGAPANLILPKRIYFSVRCRTLGKLAERAGFEPALRSPVNTLSRRAPSTTRPPLRPCLRAGRFRRAGWGDASPWGCGAECPRHGRRPTSGHPSPAPEPSKQQARGSSSRSRAECQAISAVYSLCRPHGGSRGRRRTRLRGAGAE